MNQTLLNPNQKIAFVQAGWHADIVGEGRKSFIKEMATKGVSESKIEIFDVPGSLEIPLMAKKLAETGQYAAIVCCGFIINGGIYHHEYVNHAVLDGMMRVQLDTGIPVLSVVLTPHYFHDKEEHQKFFFDHFTVKGKEAAEACIMTLENMNRFIAMDKAA
ncbi:MAG: 6,7-dimethyl-8-ribityllumazine synthase [Alphaproteobacteria bacterium]|nr:6,7-dimethyl-8-ribityllumazine synthase [Alphaproteobacteria bacterium]